MLAHSCVSYNICQCPISLGGLLSIGDAAKLWYVTSEAMLLLVYTKTLSAACVAGLQCGSTKFSPSKITDFAKSQVTSLIYFCVDLLFSFILHYHVSFEFIHECTRLSSVTFDPKFLTLHFVLCFYFRLCYFMIIFFYQMQPQMLVGVSACSFE